MENDDFAPLLRRAEDLARQAEKSGTVRSTGFLTPAERQYIERRLRTAGGCEPVFSGGREGCERCCAFFLPDYMTADQLEASDYISAIKLTAHFGEPGHRDYMGAILAMGVGRQWVGDISVDGETAYIICLPSVLKHLLSIDKVGSCAVTAEEIPLQSLPTTRVETRSRSFSVMSMRLDAVVAGMFGLSRTESARQISAGNVNVNYIQCLKSDCPARAGDIISLRGSGKGVVTGTGGASRKGRLFVNAEIYL